MKTGVIFGKFFPLHTGHIHFINMASSLVDKLYIFVGVDSDRDQILFNDSKLRAFPTPQDRLRWVAKTFQKQDTIEVHLLDESGIPFYPNGWAGWSDRVKEKFKKFDINPDIVFSSELEDIENYQKYFGLPTKIIDATRSFVHISATDIRQHPFRNWDYIPNEVKPFFVRTVAILGGESSGKSILVNKLAHVFNTTSAWEYGRDYVYQELGGTEEALQYSDYPKIALEHHKYIEYAVRHANRIAFLDTDFLTTQAFCIQYEGKKDPVLDTLINEFQFDKVILLDNNTPWVPDRMRSLGTPQKRRDFQNLLIDLLDEYDIEYTVIDDESYEDRYLAAIEIVQQLLND